MRGDTHRSDLVPVQIGKITHVPHVLLSFDVCPTAHRNNNVSNDHMIAGNIFRSSESPSSRSRRVAIILCHSLIESEGRHARSGGQSGMVG